MVVQPHTDLSFFLFIPWKGARGSAITVHTLKVDGLLVLKLGVS